MQSLRIIDVKISPFTLALNRPFNIAGHALRERHGFYLLATTSDGYTCRAEIAPLPGISAESHEMAGRDAQKICEAFAGRRVPADRQELISDLKNDSSLSFCCASARFGAESLCFGLACQAKGMNLAQFLGATHSEKPGAGLVQGDPENIESQVKTMLAHGVNVFKLKVGGRDISLEAKKVQRVRAIIGVNATIRLDANRSWSVSEAVRFALLAGGQQIEFIEEPVSDPGGIYEFYQATHMLVALDETLCMLRCAVYAPGRCMPTLASYEGVAGFVIKPMILGGIITAMDWINEAKRLGKKAVISSAFESPVGLNVLKALAGLTGQTAGIGTIDWLKPHES